MFTTAPHPGSLRPAGSDLPPTLRPLAVLSSAPRPDRRTSALAALAVYLLAGAGLMTLGRTVRAVVKEIRTEPTSVPVEFDRPAQPALPQRAQPVATTQPPPEFKPPRVESDIPPDEVPAQLPTKNRADENTRSATDEELRNGRAVVPGHYPGTRHGTGGDGVPGSATVYDVSAQPPQVLRAVNPLYPEHARRARVQGPVELLITIDAAGTPSAVQVLSGHPAFHAEAERAARQWRFAPAQVGGEAVPARFRLTISFRLA